MKLTNFKLCYSFFILVILVHLSLQTILRAKEAGIIGEILEKQECACNEGMTVTNNGTQLDSNIYPWTIAVIKQNLTTCGGALITKDFAITAAHCLQRTNILKYVGDGKCLVSKKTQSCFESNENLLVGFMDEKEPKIGRRSSIKRYYTHPQYEPLKNPYDIALIHLATPSDCNKFNRPICLSFRQEDIKYGTTVTLAGWGTDILAGGDPREDVLTEVELTLWTKECCRKELKDPNTFCATGKCEGVCDGDSGSVTFLQSKDNVYYAVGITSMLKGNVCRHSTPAYFSKILAYKCWIEEIVGKESSSG